MPLSTRADAVDGWKAARTERLTLAIPASELGADKPVVTLNGPPGKDVSLWFDKAVFGAQTRSDLADLGVGAADARDMAAYLYTLR